MTAGIVVAIMITPIITSITREVFATTPALAAGGGVRARRDAVGDDPRLGVPAQPRRSGVGGDDRLRTRDRRDHRGCTCRREQSSRSARTCSVRATRSRAIIANQFGESTGVYQAALIGMGVVLLGVHRGRRHIGAVRRRARTSGGQEPSYDLRPSTDRRSMLTPASRFALAPDQEHDRRRCSSCLAFLVALVPLVFIVGYVIQRGSEIFGWDFLTEPPPFSERLPGPGWARPSPARC